MLKTTRKSSIRTVRTALRGVVFCLPIVVFCLVSTSSAVMILPIWTRTRAMAMAPATPIHANVVMFIANNHFMAMLAPLHQHHTSST